MRPCSADPGPRPGARSARLPVGMHLKDLQGRIPPALYTALAGNIGELRPPQALAIEAHLLDGTNLVVSAPTAAGKTLVGELAGVKRALEGKGKLIWACPLRALASEKYQEFKARYEPLGLRTALSIGDYDSADPFLARYDIIVCSNEKLDSLIRHGAGWLAAMGTLVIDEVHLLDDPARGPTLELLITQMRHIAPGAQLIALSATIANAREIAGWLDAAVGQSDYRPVRLEEGVYLDGTLHFDERTEPLSGKEDVPELRLIEDTLARDKSILLFYSSRRNAEAAARRAAEVVRPRLPDQDRRELVRLGQEALKALGTPTRQCQKLADCLVRGAAFHHAGLVAEQRRLVEEAFRTRLLKVICCTPTLALGINLPSFRSVVRDLRRYSEEAGSAWIPVREWKQYVGRSGRPGLEEWGEGIAIARTEDERDAILEHYIRAGPEPVRSQLAAEPALRMAMLGLIAAGFVRSLPGAAQFFSRTFFGYQYRDAVPLTDALDRVIHLLESFGFVTRQGTRMDVTRIGRRVAELYIDPLSAFTMIERLGDGRPKNELSYLHLICSCGELWPRLRCRPREWHELAGRRAGLERWLFDPPPPWEPDYETRLRILKTALMLDDWIDEKSEAELLDRWQEAPGELRTHLVTGDWLLYAASELARLTGRKKEGTALATLRLRVRAGVRAELMPLVAFEGIGRVRARILFQAGIRTADDIGAASQERLARLLGPAIAASLKQQVGQASPGGASC